MSVVKSPDSASGRIARAIVRGLHEGGFVPGQRLVETDLVTLYGASRSAVREAIKRLEGDGIVDILPHRGAQIRRLTEREASDALKVIEYCSGLAARLAAERINEGENRADFEKVMEQLLAFESDAEDFEQVRARNRFYRSLARLSGSRELQRFIPNLQVHLLRNRYVLPKAERFQDYRDLSQAIFAGDGDRAEDLCRAHVRRSASAGHKGD